MNEELMDFVKWLPEHVELFKGLTTEETVSKINNLSTSEEGKETLKQLTKQYKNTEMGIFKEGGKLHQLLCFKTGGKGPDCGCNKIKKAGYGRKITNYITDEDAHALETGTYRRSYTDEFGNKIEARPAVWKNGRLGSGITYMAVTPQNDTLYRTVGFDLEPSDKERMKKVVPWGGSYDYDYHNDDSDWKRSQNYYPAVINTINSIPPMMQSGGEISRRSALSVLRATGSSNAESRKEYRDAKRDARELGLRGKKMRQVARNTAMSRGLDRISPASDDVEIEDIPISFEDTFANIEVPTSLGISIMDKVPVTPNDVIGGSFKEAFAEARKRGLKDFVWDNDNAKYSRYSTALANSSKKKEEPKIITSPTSSYPVYIAPKDSGFGEKIKMAIINNAPYMK